MFASHHIAKGFAAALMLIPIGSAPALAQASSAAPIEYLQYDLTPYFDLMVRSSHAYQDWQPNSGIEFEGRIDLQRLVRLCARCGPPGVTDGGGCPLTAHCTVHRV